MFIFTIHPSTYDAEFGLDFFIHFFNAKDSKPIVVSALSPTTLNAVGQHSKGTVSRDF